MDHDAVLHAKVLLLDVHRLDLAREVQAYRTLLEVNPAAYGPKLARALVRTTHGAALRELPGVRLELTEEALTALAGLSEADRLRDGLLPHVLDAHQRELCAVGRRPEALAVRARLLAMGRSAAGAQDGPPGGLAGWADGLAEEQRHREAAEAYAEIVRCDRTADRPENPATVIALAAQWEAAGRLDAALDALDVLVDRQRAEAGPWPGAMSCLLYTLLHRARLLDAHGRAGQAAAARAEALGLLTHLSGSRGNPFGFRQAEYWATLLALSGRPDEHPAPGEPVPPYGRPPRTWSPDVRERFRAERASLAAEVEALLPLAGADPDTHLAALVTRQRRLLVRAGVDAGAEAGNGTGRMLDELLPLFDRAVALARRLHALDHPGGPAALARALTDRATMFTAVGQYGYALADLRQAPAAGAQPAAR
ncbi:hypothetical protein [Kitasatospora sp. NPDC088346]|uniref:hypothetical protein n=1 Tax=Kitasatospora sp. NPDC088346 TaxID=3364073 RepID=UPI003817E8D2